MVCPTRTACKAVILQLNVVQCLEVIWESCATHVASERHWPQSLKTKTMSLLIIMSTAMHVPHMVLGLSILVPPVGLMACLGLWEPSCMTQPDMG
jgi:hypothetical protein